MINNGTQLPENSQRLVSQGLYDQHEELSLFDRLRTTLTLPALPPIASQILKMCRNEDTEVEKLAELVSQDPAVVGRLLQIANSSYYGGARHKVTSIPQAITLLGMNAVGSLAFSFCFHRLFRDMNHPKHGGMDHVQYWRRSIIASIAGRALGTWSKVPDPELLFLGSLLQDIGLLALNEVAPEVTRTLTMDANGDHGQLATFERQYFGCDHATMGGWMAETWQLPEEFQTIIQSSHHPDDLDESVEFKTIMLCVALSGRLADIWCNPDTAKATNEAATAAKDWLDLNPEDVQDILTQIPAGLSEMASFFQAKIGSADEIDQPLQIAKDILLTGSSVMAIQDDI